MRVEVGPVDDALVMEDAVAQVADAFPAGVHFFHVPLRTRGVGEGLAREEVAQAGPAVGLVEEAGPKTKLQLGHHAARSDGLAVGLEFLAGLTQLFLLPRGQRGRALYHSAVP